MSNFFQGLIMGLAYVAPIGLQNIFVINSALGVSKKQVFFTAAAVIFFDIALALACFFGVGALIERVDLFRYGILLIGSLVVIYLGITLVLKKNFLETQSKTLPPAKVITTAFVVTWCNPQAIIDGTLMLGAFRSTLESSQALRFILGVSLASWLWFTGLTLFICLFKNKFTPKVLRVINIICGGIIIFYGCKLLYSFFILL